MINEVNVSVIIPMYNAADYIKPCMESLLAQTLQEYEIICVDDGSTDETVEIVEEYREKNERIQVIRQSNLYAGAARNAGLKKALGEYVIFLDADDFFEEKMLEIVYNKAKLTDADVIIFDGRTYNTVSGEYKEVNHYLQREMIPKKDVFNRTDFPEKNLLSITNPAPWNKMFKKQFVEENKLHFQSLSNTNDAYFVLTALSRAEKIATVKERFVNYRINRPGSTQAGKRKAPYCFIDAYEAVYKQLQQWNIYNDVKKGLTDVFLSTCNFSLGSHRDNRIKMEIARRLKESFLYTTGELEQPEDYYRNHEHYIAVKSLISGIDWRESKFAVRERKEEVRKQGKDSEQAKVTVIVPIYNVEDYLEECLDSVVNQTLREIEIICVNDGSTDKSCTIAEKYAERDSRITLIDKTNGGLSSARNTGIRYANGEYVYFMDSDDYIEPNALEILYSMAKENELELIYFDAVSFMDDASEDVPDNFKSYYERKNDYSKVVSGLEFINQLEENGEYRPSACLQMVQKNFLDTYGFRFYEGILHEDNLYTFSVLIKAKRVSHIGRPLYHRRIRNGSIVTMSVGFEHCYGYFVTYLEMIKCMEELDSSDLKLKEGLQDILYRIIANARDTYIRIPELERQWFVFMDSEKYYFFLVLVYNTANAKIEKDYIQNRLNQTFREKSEINRKLQITYGEKRERGVQLKEVKKELKEIRTELKGKKKEIAKNQKKYDSLHKNYKKLERRSVICWMKKIFRKVKSMLAK
jgi:glycosyltransferase involved in cell wall biosynthesis